MTRKPNPPFGSKRKRCLDVIVSALLLLAAIPLTVLVALLVRVFMGAPVFHRELRPGAGMRPFEFWKFRSMVPAVSAKTTDAERLTPFGRMLRKCSLDELPQLWLVLTGKMSLVGPRPLRLDYLGFFTPLEQIRFSVRPGITGWAQVHGRNRCPWDERLARDVWYVENWSFWLDLRILFRTACQVVRASNVIVDPASEMLNFDDERRLRTTEAS